MYTIELLSPGGKFKAMIVFRTMSLGDKRVFLLVDEENKYYYRKEYSFRATRNLLKVEPYLTTLLADIKPEYAKFASSLASYFVERLDDGPISYERQIPGLEEIVTHPVTGSQTSIQNAIMNLNDVCLWSREQIADWLETLDVNPILNDPKEEYYV